MMTAVVVSGLTTTSTTTTPRIAIIGGGAAGLACARIFSRSSNNNNNCIRCVVYEKDNFVGGVWKHQPPPTTTAASEQQHRPMYKGLRTNLPKEIMAFREFPFPKDLDDDDDGASFVTHRQVQRYLERYRETFHLQVQMGQQVQHLKVLSNSKPSCFTPPPPLNGTEDVWPQVELTILDKDATTTRTEIFDAVLIANGHYSLPSAPDIPGLNEFFQGKRIMHSVAYDEPDEFKDQTVLCIGGRASGADIAREIATVAKHVYVSDSAKADGAPQTLEEASGSSSSSSITWVPATQQVLPNGNIQFAKDCPLQAESVDVIMLCTGYDYSMPFIDGQSGLEFSTVQRRVQPLYRQLFHAQYPNVAFIGLPHSVLPFPFFELQAEACYNVWNTKGVANLPGPLERHEAAQCDAVSGGQGKPSGTGRIEDTHYLGNAQWDYCREMAILAGNYDESLEQYLTINKEIYDHAGSRRKGFPGGPDLYRGIRYDRNHEAQSWRVLDKVSIINSQSNQH